MVERGLVDIVVIGKYLGIDYYMGCEGVGHFVVVVGDGKFLGVDYYIDERGWAHCWCRGR